MIEINEATISKLVLHRISTEEKNSFLSDEVFEISNKEEEDILKRIFLKSFQTSNITYEFIHEVDIELNTLLKLSKNIYENGNFISKSNNIYQHLKSVSKHPNIKDGDLFIVKFDEIKLNNKFYEALGIYKIEKKESFIETTTNKKGELVFSFRKGIGSKRLDKACLIVFTEQPYTIFVIDNNSTETDYWQNEFLKVNLRNDNVNNTNQFLTLTKSFVTEQFPTEFEVTKADQIDLLNRSFDYFKSHKNFDKKEFENEVFQNIGIIKSFRTFDTSYKEEKEIEIADDFTISTQAVKKQERVFKSVLRLDKNFHIYIHGNKELIEHGVDENGRKYYKIYYENEA